ncbi:MAG: hypothetical protein ACKOFW_04740, partial [Planctomycetaceae bacterium]
MPVRKLKRPIYKGQHGLVPARTSTAFYKSRESRAVELPARELFHSDSKTLFRVLVRTTLPP